MSFIPILFHRGDQLGEATSWADYYDLIWAGWQPGAPAGPLPRSQIYAYLSDLDALRDSIGTPSSGGVVDPLDPEVMIFS